ncbi:hypothetical protein GWI33_021137 [Rhynchophorus ferrugineus]|uniref:Uncharacterized protein n=1 Tax=Rhynchophorus ferrugineus TaxID=354439 RepID=A0A834LZX4_RHYFE|nr:hypothetical protein GWI33_021137 [Rhynchophorus ferrugineus]
MRRMNVRCTFLGIDLGSPSLARGLLMTVFFELNGWMSVGGMEVRIRGAPGCWWRRWRGGDGVNPGKNAERMDGGVLGRGVADANGPARDLRVRLLRLAVLETSVGAREINDPELAEGGGIARSLELGG